MKSALAPRFDDAVQQCRNRSFGVAILDLRLLEKDGIALLEAIQPTQREIRAIIHTGHGSFGSAKDAVNLGAFAYVEKGGDPAELVRQVHRAAKDFLSAALLRSEQRFVDLLNDVGAIVWECELPSRQFTFVSQQAESILGYPVSQWLDEVDFCSTHVHPDDRERCVELCSESSKRGQDHVLDYRAIAADGRVVWLSNVVHVVKDETGQPIQLRGVMTDITARKQAEEALRNSEVRYRSLVENAPICIHEVDLAQRISSINPCGLQMVGAEDAVAVVSKEYLSFVDDADRKRIQSLMKAAYEGEASSFEFGCRIGDQIRQFASNFIPICDEGGAVIKLMGTTEDVTDSRKALEQVHIRGSAIASADAGIVICDCKTPDIPIIYCNPAFERLTGYSREEIVGQNCRLLQAGDRDQDGVRVLREAIATGRDCTATIRNYRKDGRMFWNEVRISPICDQDGQVTHFVGFQNDITDRLEAEWKLRESEDRFRTIFEQAAVGVALIETHSGRFVRVNQKYMDLIGYPHDEMTQMAFMDITHPNDLAEYLASMQKLHAGEISEFSMEKRLIRKDGSPIWVNLTVSPTWEEGTEPRFHIAIVQDISARVAAEEQMREHQQTLSHVSRLSTMGEMVAGIAHEINQPLFSIRNFSSACVNALQQGADHIPDAVDYVTEIDKQSRRAAEIMKRLADFVRHKKPRRSSADLNQLADDAIDLVAFEADRRQVTVRREFEQPGRHIAADVVQVQQVLVNLLRNAYDALQANDARDRHVLVRTSLHGDEVKIEISDNGPGFSDETAASMFETFFSTKEQGMGMGLAIARSIIKEHGGSLHGCRNQDGGATFAINLPAEKEQLNAVAANRLHCG